MAIKGKELQEFRPTIRYMDGEGITLQTIKEAIADAGRNYGIPIAFQNDEVSNGLFSDNIPCVVMYHPEHYSDYLRFCIQRGTQGKVALISVYTCGTSRQLKKDAIAGNKTGAGAALLFGGAAGVGYAIGAGIRKAANAIGRNKSKLEEEKNWYGAIQGILDEVVR